MRVDDREEMRWVKMSVDPPSRSKQDSPTTPLSPWAGYYLNLPESNLPEVPYCCTMKKTAILIDGEWFRRGLQVILRILQGRVNLSKDLIKDADLVRTITPIP